MNVLKKYSIAYKGLDAGKHRFEFDVDDKFFAAFDGGEITKGKARVEVELSKGGSVGSSGGTSSGMSLHITIKGNVTVECDRCLEDLEMPVDYEGDLQVRFSETETESDGEVMWISPNEPEINLAQYIYESIWLSLPAQRVHPNNANGESMCDPEMLKRFRIVSQEEFDDIAGEAEKRGGEKERSEDRGKEKGEEKMGDKKDAGTGNLWSKLEELKNKLKEGE